MVVIGEDYFHSPLAYIGLEAVFASFWADFFMACSDKTGDKNSVSLGRNIGDFGLGCQGQTCHIMLGTRVFRGTGVCRAGIVRWERKGEQARDLLRDGVLRGKV